VTVRLLIVAAAVAAPFVFYWLYRRLRGVRGPWPATFLWIAGAVLAVEALALAVFAEKPLGPGRYEPAHLDGDRIVRERTVPEAPP
jgi:hypothetical protein